MVSSKKSDLSCHQQGSQSHQAPKSLAKSDTTPFPVAKMVPVQILKMAPVSNVDQPAAVTSVSRLQIPSYSEGLKTNDQDMNNNVELDLEKNTQATVMCSQINKGNNNAEAKIVPGTASVTATLPVEEINKIINTVPETYQFADAKSNDDERSGARRNEVIREEEQEELNAEAIVLSTTTTTTTTVTLVFLSNQQDRTLSTETENQAQRQKVEAIRIEGYNKFSLVEESKNEQEQDIEAKRVEEPATTTEEKPHESESDASDAQSSSENEQDIEAKRVKESAIAKKRRHKKKRKAAATASTSEEQPHKSESEKEQDVETKRVEESAITTEEKPHESWFDAESSWEEQDMEAKRVEEAAAAKKKTEKRKRKKSKAEKRNESCLSIGILSLALINCLACSSMICITNHSNAQPS
ncbi:uncharacterized protein LOC133744312 [Rosa rugosa]|uniref:uncharacterized protein LOC133744312 n=1 Tax=Rosa rugosa TaxID=74645 RepID=UPI002B4079ED|nr:uncharacterized protein LOC133744312 [Rosa rugosa]